MESYEELLMQAVEENDINCVKFCLAKGANPNKICSVGMTPIGAAAQNGNLMILKFLTESQRSALNKSIRNENAALHLDLDNSRKMKNIGYYVVCDDLDNLDFDNGPTPEGMDALEWDMEVTEENTEELASTPPEARIYKWYADILNRTAVVLQSPENDIARLDRYGLNALHYAISEGHYDVVQYLLDNFKEIGVNQSDANIVSPLQIAVIKQDIKMVKILLQKGANINFANRHRKTSLHLAAQEGNLELVQVLVENGANLNAQDIDECTPLSVAIFCEHEVIAKYLIQKGTRLNCEEMCGHTVLHRAVWNNMTNTVKTLLEAEAKVIQSHYLLHTAVRNNNLEIVEALHKSGAAVNVRDEQGNTPLIVACTHQTFEIAKYLLKNGASANVRNEINSLTALHICVEHIHNKDMFRRFLDLLICYGADINSTCYMGSVFFYSIIANEAAACLLVKYGANVNLKEERAVVDYLSAAKKNQHNILVKLIILAGFNFNNLLFDIKFLKTQPVDPLYDYIVFTKSNPLSLKDICRIKIRGVLGSNVILKIQKLPLPTVLLQFLAFDDIYY
ncbi:ankyrin-1 [Agrilus planipennis]|uniref:Ankyrin-1 n=1 Tax=Agrilus planipennis TaxID=224129 RepID=A0A1W4WZX8_AGRPL|nr:ankyrin-1 [Agrilus planipennis]